MEPNRAKDMEAVGLVEPNTKNHDMETVEFVEPRPKQMTWRASSSWSRTRKDMVTLEFVGPKTEANDMESIGFVEPNRAKDMEAVGLVGPKPNQTTRNMESVEFVALNTSQRDMETVGSWSKHGTKTWRPWSSCGAQDVEDLMARKRKLAVDLPESPIPITDELLNEFAPDRPLTAEEVESASRRFKKALLERALEPSSVTMSGINPAKKKKRR